MTPLRKRLIEELEIRNYSPKTISMYVGNVSRLARYYGTSPDRLTREQIRRYLVHLVQERGLSMGTYRQDERRTVEFYSTGVSTDVGVAQSNPGRSEAM